MIVGCVMFWVVEAGIAGMAFGRLGLVGLAGVGQMIRGDARISLELSRCCSKLFLS